MHQLALELLQPRDLGPAPLIQRARARHQHVAHILKALDHIALAIHALKPRSPLPRLLVPPGAHTPTAKPHVPPHIVLARDALPVPQDLVAAGVERAPVDVALEAELVRVRGDVARDARVPVLEPRAAEVGVLVVDGERDVGHVLREHDCGYDPRDPRADVDDAEWAGGVDGPFGDQRVRVGGWVEAGAGHHGFLLVRQ